MSAADQIRLNFLTIVSLLRRGQVRRAAFSVHGLVKGVLNFGLWSGLGRRHEQGVFALARKEDARTSAGGPGLTWEERAGAYYQGFSRGPANDSVAVHGGITVL